jgi:hypothetical protein
LLPSRTNIVPPEVLTKCNSSSGLVVPIPTLPSTSTLPVTPKEPVICALPEKIPSHEPELRPVKPEPSPTKEPVNEDPVKLVPMKSPLALILPEAVIAPANSTLLEFNLVGISGSIMGPICNLPSSAEILGLLVKDSKVKPEFASSPCALNSFPKKDVSTLPDILPEAVIAPANSTLLEFNLVGISGSIMGPICNLPSSAEILGLLVKDSKVKPEFASSPCALNSFPKKDVSTLPDILPEAVIAPANSTLLEFNLVGISGSIMGPICNLPSSAEILGLLVKIVK